jgi:hypothetical protein
LGMSRNLFNVVVSFNLLRSVAFDRWRVSRWKFLVNYIPTSAYTCFSYHI